MRAGGLNRGGARHVRHQAHRLEDFSPQQLREMLAEPDLALIVGAPLTAKQIDGIEATAKEVVETKAKKAAA